VICRIIILFVIMSLSSYSNADISNNNESNSWVIYIALGPYSANRMALMNHVDIDLKQYKYPLYIGYVYSTDSKIVHYRSFTPLADKVLKRWCEYAARGGFNIPGYGNYYNGDKDYVYAASINLQQFEGFVVIMRGIGVEPDDEWRPVFQQMFTIDDDPDATSRKMNKIFKTYSPLNKRSDHF
jgi:hypothetical protein